MNVYDFDGTLYAGDSSIEFVSFCRRRHPRLWLCAPRQLLAQLRYRRGRIDRQSFKDELYCFCARVSDIRQEVRLFWDRNEGKLAAWYRAQHREDDVVISASPDFLLREACDRLGVRFLLASEVDPRTGHSTAPNCRGAEKARRFFAAFPDGVIDRFYTDLRTDRYLVPFARESFLVTGDRREPWDGT